jgi:hypothetical protein
MNSTCTQIHITRDEIYSFLKCCVDKFDLSIHNYIYHPFSITLVSKEELGILLLKNPSAQKFLLTVKPIGDSISCFNALRAPEVDYYLFEVGESNNSTLKESCFTYQTNNEEFHALGKKISRLLKKDTFAGAIALNPKTQATVKIRTHRYSAGAKKLFDEGVKMPAIAGICLYQFPDKL